MHISPVNADSLANDTSISFPCLIVPRIVQKYTFLAMNKYLAVNDSGGSFCED